MTQRANTSTTALQRLWRLEAAICCAMQAADQVDVVLHQRDELVRCQNAVRVLSTSKSRRRQTKLTRFIDVSEDKVAIEQLFNGRVRALPFILRAKMGLVVETFSADDITKALAATETSRC